MAAPAAVDGLRVDLSDLVDRRVLSWEPRCRSRGVHLLAEVDPVLVVGAAEELAQVLDALLSNALRFSDHGDHARLTLRADRAIAVLQVSDTGIGIPPEELPLVFDRFFRGSLGRDRALGGSGLGLSIVQEIVTAHGGSVHAVSVLGEGSCFTVRLPGAGGGTSDYP